MSTPLSRYMEQHGISDAEFALRIGKDRSLVNRIRRGEVRPTLDVAAQIETLTDGEVPMQAWIEAGPAETESGPKPEADAA